MARIRTIKPELFKHAKLFNAEIATKLPLRLADVDEILTALTDLGETSTH